MSTEWPLHREVFDSLWIRDMKSWFRPAPGREAVFLMTSTIGGEPVSLRGVMKPGPRI